MRYDPARGFLMVRRPSRGGGRVFGSSVGCWKCLEINGNHGGVPRGVGASAWMSWGFGIA